MKKILLILIAITVSAFSLNAQAQKVTEDDLETVTLKPNITQNIKGFRFNTIGATVDISKGNTAKVEIIAPAIIAADITTNTDGSTFVIKQKGKFVNNRTRKEQKMFHKIHKKYNNRNAPLIHIKITVPTVEMVALYGYGSKLNFHSTFTADKLYLKCSSGRINNASFNINGGDVTILGGYSSKTNANIKGAKNMYLSTGYSSYMNITTDNIADVKLKADYSSKVELLTKKANTITINAGYSSNIKCIHQDVENVKINSNYSSSVNFVAQNCSEVDIIAGSSASVTSNMGNVEKLSIHTKYNAHVNANSKKIDELHIVGGSSAQIICKFALSENVTVRGGYNSKITLDGKYNGLESLGANLTIKNNNSNK